MDKTTRTPSTRTKRRSCPKLQPPDDRSSPDIRPLKVTPAQGNQANTRYSGRTSDQDRTSDDSQAPDDRPRPDVRRPSATGRPTTSGNPPHPHPSQITGCPTSTGRPDPREPPDVRYLSDDRRLCAAMCWAAAHVPLQFIPHLHLDYK